MNNKILSALLASFILLSAAGCSKSAEDVAATTSSAAATTTTEAETEEETEEEAPLPYVDLQGWQWVTYNGLELGGYGDANEPLTVTNIDFAGISYDFSDDTDHSEINCIIERDGEEIFNGPAGWYNQAIAYYVPIETNEAGYLIGGDYTLTLYNRDELIASTTLTVIYDEETAPVHNSIIHCTEGVTIRHYAGSDFEDSCIDNDEFASGGTGIYTTFYPSTTFMQGTYTVEWTCNGEEMEPVTYSFDCEEDSLSLFADLSFEMPDGSPMPAGDYTFDYYYDDALIATESLHLS